MIIFFRAIGDSRTFDANHFTRCINGMFLDPADISTWGNDLEFVSAGVATRTLTVTRPEDDAISARVDVCPPADCVILGAAGKTGCLPLPTSGKQATLDLKALVDTRQQNLLNYRATLGEIESGTFDYRRCPTVARTQGTTFPVLVGCAEAAFRRYRESLLLDAQAGDACVRYSQLAIKHGDASPVESAALYNILGQCIVGLAEDLADPTLYQRLVEDVLVPTEAFAGPRPLPDYVRLLASKFRRAGNSALILDYLLRSDHLPRDPRVQSVWRALLASLSQGATESGTPVK